jgi:hypothetical protein
MLTAATGVAQPLNIIGRTNCPTNPIEPITVFAPAHATTHIAVE